MEAVAQMLCTSTQEIRDYVMAKEEEEKLTAKRNKMKEKFKERLLGRQTISQLKEI
jgi:hypothetical protein